MVRELATHPTHPRHPLLLIDAPHAFASPYALLVAALCRLTGVSSVTGLTVASLVNLVMLLVALRVFVRRFALAHTEAVFYYLKVQKRDPTFRQVNEKIRGLTQPRGQTQTNSPSMAPEEIDRAFDDLLGDGD